MEQMLINHRHQHAVGQGFFHSGGLAQAHMTPRSTDNPELSYVYDCGAVRKYSDACSREIALSRCRTDSGKLDLMFLSHAHDDHVNGVRELLHARRVDTIVMPLMSVLERLIVFASSLSQGASADGFHLDLAVDTTAALAALRPRQIIYVRRTDTERDDGVQTDGGLSLVDRDGPTGPDGEMSWKIVGNGRIDRGAPGGDSGGGSVQGGTFVMEDVNAFAVSAGRQHAWLLAPYVQPGVTEIEGFLAALAGELGVPETSLRMQLELTSFRRALLTTHVPALKRAFTATCKDLNLTTMSLYSGPLTVGAVPATSASLYEVSTLGSQYTRSDPMWYCGWLGTGDADLRSPQRLRAFLDHYRRLLDRVHTLTVPHHGSERNSAAPLYNEVRPRVCVSSADSYQNWRHPASSVIQAIASSGAFSMVVTSGSRAGFMEQCFLAP